MIARLTGILAETSADGAVIDVGGVGYQVLASARTMDALGRRAEAEQGPRVLAHLQLGEQQHGAADRADRVHRAAAAMNLIADSADVDHRAVGAGLGENSGKARDHLQ